MKRVLLAVAIAMCTLAPSGAAQQRGVAFLEIALPSGRALASEGDAVLDAPVLPGSIAKIATLAAALESGAASRRTSVVCTRQIVVAGHRLTCTHPDLHRPLNASDALAHSCNVYFATIASRLPRPAFDAALVRLGLPPSDPSLPLAAAALGLEGVRATPRQLLTMMTRVAGASGSIGWRQETTDTVIDGLRRAAREGTAAALGAHAIDALAKTGTVVQNGRAQGMVVGVTPAVNPTRGFVLLASGGAGVDAVDLAVERLQRDQDRAASAGPYVRIGIANANGGYDVREMPLEDYVAGVVAGEALRGTSSAALEALAITVRTYALANRGRHASEGFDLCDLTHCQVLRTATAASRRAATATAGRVLLDRGAPAHVFYTASCGGRTARPSTVWKGERDAPFLPSHDDPACEGEPRWSRELSAAELLRTLRAAGFRGDTLRGMRVTKRDASGRVAWLALDGLTPPEISGEDFRTAVGRTLGWQYVRSTLFDVTRTGAGYRFTGRGAGHGVGLCVIGARNRAANGETADAILSFYYPGLTISATVPGSATAQPAGVRVVLPPSQERSAADVRELAERALTDLSRALAVTPPPEITLRFHPTVESYQRTTGRSWRTAAMVHGTEIQLIPLDVLRRRGVLESTIRHELAHVLTSDALEGRPLWAIEGVAAYYAGELRDNTREPRGDSAGRNGCPSDRELTSPSSTEALAAAYQRAAACAAREIRQGRSWRDVGR